MSADTPELGRPGLSDQPARDQIKTELDRNLFVDAGAGSGKTKAMVDRVCALIDQGTDVATIVAITFTEKAAAELRQRIRTELSSGRGSPHQTREATDVRSRALDRLDSAPMGTIHSFAGRLLRENPIEAGVPPLLSITDDLGSQIAFTARWEKARDFLFTVPHARAALDIVISLGVTLGHLEKLAQAFDYSWDRLELGSGAAPATAAESAHASASASASDKSPGAPLGAPAEIVRRIRAVTALRSLCAKPENDVGCRDLLILEQWSDDYLALETRVANNEIPASALFTNLYPLLLGRGIPKPVAAGSWKGEKTTVDEALADLRDYITNIVSQQVSSALELVVSVLTETVREAALERQESGDLEFHDLLVHSRALVASDESTWRRISARYPIIMLDEFQDTDPLQAELAVRLAAEKFIPTGDDWRTAQLRHGALFTVGDPKQSIYRFRRADIATFLAMGERLGEPVVLSTNFRSSEPVLRWVNEVFGELIQADENRQPDFQPLGTRPERPAWTAENGPAITVLGHDSLADPAEKAEEARDAEARDVAHLIREAVGRTSVESPAWRHEVFDKATNSWSTRPLTLSDICILIPSRTSLTALQNALDDADIEYVAEASSLVYSSEEIRDLLLTAQAIANTANEAALVTALRTSVFGCGDDELLLWASGVASGAGAALRNPWNLFGNELTEDHPSRVGRSLAFLKKVVAELPTLTPAEVLERIVVQRQLLEQQLDVPRRAREGWRRIRYIVDQAEAWHENTHGSLRDYLAWATMQQEDGARVKEAMVPETGIEAVRIMTIHSAKGLEFPMVIVAGASGSGANTVAPVLWSTDDTATTASTTQGTMEVRLLPASTAKKTFAAESSGYAALEASEKEFLAAESTRLLYVACTRAETHLAVSLHHYKGTVLPAFAAQLARAEAAATASDAYLFSAADTAPITPREPEPVLAPVAELPQEEWLALRERWIANAAIPASHPITSLAKDPENAPVENPFIGDGALVFVPEPFVADAPPKRAAAAGPRFVDLGEPAAPAASGSAAEDTEGDATGPDSSADAGHLVGTSARQGLGARLGTAVHKTLELSNLVVNDSLDGYAQVAAAQSELADWKLAAERARAALQTEPLRRAATREHWLELAMTRAVGQTVLEGVADLVYREDDGSLVIVDFKTDHTLDEAKLQGYWAQLSAYANMIHQATGDSVSQLVLVQCSKTPARVISASFFR